MRIKYYLLLPPHVLVKKVIILLTKIIVNKYQQLHDRYCPTYISNLEDKPLFQYLQNRDVIQLQSRSSTNRELLVSNYLRHRFNLLGSGWVSVKHGVACKGFEDSQYNMGKEIVVDKTGKWLEGRINRANLGCSQKIWQLIDADYVPIDWQLDFKSGYRWNENKQSQDIEYGHRAGVDVKVPWELSRMQHLVQLALSYGIDDHPNSLQCLYEFRNQTLDFIATNPPRYGVNWVCTMDVGIRVANLLLAYDVFRAFGAKFDNDFKTVFTQTIYQHAQYIIQNLEWSETLTSNHYLANIAGLLFASAYLQKNQRTDSWLIFSVHELINEVEKQFYKEGSNFEASTSYHRLSAEMVVYATALVLGMPDEKKAALGGDVFAAAKVPHRYKNKPLPLYTIPGSAQTSPFPKWYFKRLFNMAQFTMAVTKLNQKVVQIGDNDNGRFFKVQPFFEQSDLLRKESNSDTRFDSTTFKMTQEVFLNHNHLISAISGLFKKNDKLAKYAESNVLDYAMTNAFSKHKIYFEEWAKNSEPSNEMPYKNHSLKIVPNHCDRLVLDFSGKNLLHNLELLSYTDFGLYIFKSKYLFLSIRCGSIGQNGNGGHAHNDQLAIELNVDGQDVIVDPGTFVYTPSTKQRQRYRSVSAHFSPQMESLEPGNIELGMWQLGNEAKGQCHYFRDTTFQGFHIGYGQAVWRQVEIKQHHLIITDWFGGKAKLKGLKELYNSLNDKGALVTFCPGYGI